MTAVAERPRRDRSLPATADSTHCELAVALTFTGVIALLLATALLAALTRRGLYQDGAYYLYRLGEREWFYLVDPARTTVQVLRQAPVVALMKLGDASLPTLAVAFSLAMLALPIVITALTWIIAPRNTRAFVLFPMMHLLAGFSTMDFDAVAEGAIGAAYCWVLLFLLVFRTRRIVSQLVFIALCIPAFWLHEGLCVLMPCLLLAGALRLRTATTALERLFVVAVAVLVVAIINYQLRWIIHPRILGERESALQDLYGFHFIYHDGQLNVPAVSAAVASLALLWIFFAGAREPAAAGTARLVAAGFAVLAGAMAPLPWLVERCIAPHAQVAARYDPVFASAALALVLLYAVATRLPARRWANRPSLVIVLTLALAQTSADLAATARWRAYMADFSGRLSQLAGLVPWPSTLATGDAARDADWRMMSAGWVTPILSILLAPGGTVRAIIDYPADAWRPIEPANVASLPRLRGITYAPYERALHGPDAAATGNRPDTK